MPDIDKLFRKTLSGMSFKGKLARLSRNKFIQLFWCPFESVMFGFDRADTPT